MKVPETLGLYKDPASASVRVATMPSKRKKNKRRMRRVVSVELCSHLCSVSGNSWRRSLPKPRKNLKCTEYLNLKMLRDFNGRRLLHEFVLISMISPTQVKSTHNSLSCATCQIFIYLEMGQIQTPQQGSAGCLPTVLWCLRCLCHHRYLACEHWGPRGASNTGSSFPSVTIASVQILNPQLTRSCVERLAPTPSPPPGAPSRPHSITRLYLVGL